MRQEAQSRFVSQCRGGQEGKDKEATRMDQSLPVRWMVGGGARFWSFQYCRHAVALVHSAFFLATSDGEAKQSSRTWDLLHMLSKLPRHGMTCTLKICCVTTSLAKILLF